jgi:hypothetical protein
MLTGG